MNQMNITPQDNNSSFSQFVLTREEAFRYSEKDTFFSKTGKFAVGTALTTTACFAAIVETVLSSLIAILTSPIYLIAPKSYIQITQHTLDSVITIVAAAKRTFGAEIEAAPPPVEAEVKQKTPVSPAPPAPPSIQSKKVEKLPELSQNFASRALQFSKEHKTLMIAIALGTATIAATAFYFYYMKTPPPSNLPIPLPPTSTATLSTGSPATSISSTTTTIISPSNTWADNLKAIVTKTNQPSISSSTTSLSSTSSTPTTITLSERAKTVLTATQSLSTSLPPSTTSNTNTVGKTIATLTNQHTASSISSSTVTSTSTPATNRLSFSSAKMLILFSLSLGIIGIILKHSRLNRAAQDTEKAATGESGAGAKKKAKREDDGLECLRSAAEGVALPSVTSAEQDSPPPVRSPAPPTKAATVAPAFAPPPPPPPAPTISPTTGLILTPLPAARPPAPPIRAAKPLLTPLTRAAPAAGRPPAPPAGRVLAAPRDILAHRAAMLARPPASPAAGRPPAPSTRLASPAARPPAPPTRLASPAAGRSPPTTPPPLAARPPAPPIRAAKPLLTPTSQSAPQGARPLPTPPTRATTSAARPPAPPIRAKPLPTPTPRSTPSAARSPAPSAARLSAPPAGRALALPADQAQNAKKAADSSGTGGASSKAADSSGTGGASSGESKLTFAALRAQAKAKGAKNPDRPYNRRGFQQRVRNKNPTATPTLAAPSGGKGKSFAALADLVEKGGLTDALGRLAPEGMEEATAPTSGDSSLDSASSSEGSGSEDSSNEFGDLASLAAEVEYE